ncbi:hypothetical protein [Parerythrobacter lacustris]|uniref:UrcA family protein n=1 Tax=Parerythrobacter lacustris TaxID=2969984 RepID=A0ABT1XKY2_9SPHN|nr:hypothetical protein [Parerythrobacter lacustris]MCR2832324.1 hypothetical protein [Parerythrobacter lacustris]
MIFLALATFFGTQATGYEVDPLVGASWRDYSICVETRMAELGPSGAGIDDIFEAAKTQCVASRLDAYFLTEPHLEKLGPSPSGKSAQQIAIEILDDYALAAKDRARVTILRERADLAPIDVSRL